MLPGALKNMGVGRPILVPVTIFLSDFLFSSIVDNMRGLCQTQASLALLVSSFNLKFRPATVSPLRVGSAALSEGRPRVASILALQGHGLTQFSNHLEIHYLHEHSQVPKSLTSLTLTQNFLNLSLQGACS